SSLCTMVLPKCPQPPVTMKRRFIIGSPHFCQMKTMECHTGMTKSKGCGFYGYYSADSEKYQWETAVEI
ncbi:MAG: hypothetical protein RR226_05480, partial [Oscillospiraceae bacterium]